MNEDWRCPSREAPEPSAHVLPVGETACSKCGRELIPAKPVADHTSCSRRRFGSGCVPFTEGSNE